MSYVYDGFETETYTQVNKKNFGTVQTENSFFSMHRQKTFHAVCRTFTATFHIFSVRKVT